MGLTHSELKGVAIAWLFARGCSSFAEEVPTNNGVADALGVKMSRPNFAPIQYDSYYIEAKASRSDLICEKQKQVYWRAINVENNEIDFYYLIVSDGVKVEEELYPKFGVIDERGNVLRKAKRFTTKRDGKEHLRHIAHRLVYQVYGKMYLGEQKEPQNGSEVIPLDGF